MLKLSIVIVTYNNQKTIKKCLASILNSDLTNINLNLIIIDNNSSDKTISSVKKFFSSGPIADHPFFAGYFLVANKSNLGFAKAVNQGLKLAQEKTNPDYFFLLNPDAYLEKKCLRTLLKSSSLKKSTQSLKSPLIINLKNKKPWFSGGKLSWLKMRTKHLSDNNQSTDYLTGCALLIPKEIVQAIGFFDENFFLYYEDTDFSLRSKQAGFSLEIIPSALAYHQESYSFKSITDKQKNGPSFELKNYYLSMSGLYFFYKHYPRWGKIYFWLFFFLRLIYHSLFSGKVEVARGIKSFWHKH